MSAHVPILILKALHVMVSFAVNEEQKTQLTPNYQLYNHRNASHRGDSQLQTTIGLVLLLSKSKRIGIDPVDYRTWSKGCDRYITEINPTYNKKNYCMTAKYEVRYCWINRTWRQGPYVGLSILVKWHSSTNILHLLTNKVPWVMKICFVV